MMAFGIQDDTILKINNDIPMQDVIRSRNLSLEDIGLYVILKDFYGDNIFYFYSALNLEFKKKYSRKDIEKSLDNLMDHGYIKY